MQYQSDSKNIADLSDSKVIFTDTTGSYYMSALLSHADYLNSLGVVLSSSDNLASPLTLGTPANFVSGSTAPVSMTDISAIWNDYLASNKALSKATLQEEKFNFYVQ